MSVVAELSAILTAVVAVWGYGHYRLDQREKRIKLEAYLKGERSGARGDEKGQRSLLHLMAKLGMTEAELLSASFVSKHIGRKIAADPDTGRAAALLLEYRALSSNGSETPIQTSSLAWLGFLRGRNSPRATGSGSVKG